MRNYSAIALLVALGGLVPAQRPVVEKPALDLTAIRRLPLLEGERYKPLDSMAREWIEQITGKERFRGTDPVLLFLFLRFEPEKARAEKLIRLPDVDIAAEAGFEVKAGEEHASFDDLATSEKFQLRVAEARGRKSELRTEADNALLTLRMHATVLGGIAGLQSGWEQASQVEHRGLLPFLPPPGAPTKGHKYAWLSPVEVPMAGWPAGRVDPALQALTDLRVAWVSDDGKAFTAASERLVDAAAALGYPANAGEASFPGMAHIDREVRLNRLAPFKIATYVYFVGAFLALIAAVLPKVRALWIAALVPTFAAFALHVWGIEERTALSGRAMIGNFYESMVFVAGAGVLSGLVFEFIFRNRWFHMAGAFAGFVALYVATHNPGFMHPAITNLQPVLINNNWIHIHVPTIMTSYAVLAVAILMAHVYCIKSFWQGESHPDQRQLVKSLFWLIPVGVISLFAGIVLGGVWADASWGRFWGWDPKEVGALILWLHFMILIHGRWAGWLRDFGTAFGTLLGGWTLIWSYYGTNFFWSGLHSYADAGTGASIPAWLLIWTPVELLFAAALLAVRHSRKRLSPSFAALAPPSPLSAVPHPHLEPHPSPRQA